MSHKVSNRLSKLERAVMCRIANGETPADIAVTLGLSVKTVSTYRCRILMKTGLKSNAAIALLAYQADMVNGHSGELVKAFKEMNSGNPKHPRRKAKTQPGVDHKSDSPNPGNA